jgi:serine/threonine-protein kinase RsbW
MNFNLFGNSHSDIDEIPSGGMGIKLMGKIADELSYTRTSDNRNCLLIVKYFSQNSTQAGCFKRAISILNSFNWLQEQPTPQSDRSSNPPIHKTHLRVISELHSVTEVLEWVEQLENLPIPEAVLQQCKLALFEGFTNAVRHAHKTLPSNTPIELAIAVFQDRLEIEICDWGQPFDLKAKLKEELPEKTLFCWNELSFTFH